MLLPASTMALSHGHVYKKNTRPSFHSYNELLLTVDLRFLLLGQKIFRYLLHEVRLRTEEIPDPVSEVEIAMIIVVDHHGRLHPDEGDPHIETETERAIARPDTTVAVEALAAAALAALDGVANHISDKKAEKS